MNRIRAWRFLATVLLLLMAPATRIAAQDGRPLLQGPIWVYNNWSAYDELSDAVPLSEELAMRELDEVLRLRKLGVRFDYYMMDAFWYDPEGGYRTWRADSWPEGPDRWIEAVKAHGMEPGLWFSTNTLTQLKPVSVWRDSLDKHGHAMALYAGGFLDDFMDVLQFWYDHGIRMFKFDFAEFYATAPGDESVLNPREIRARNMWALYQALIDFRRDNPDVVLVGFNGIVGDVSSVARPVTYFAKHWLEVFDTLYSGDPRPADVPAMDFWRSMDIYSDHMVRAFEQHDIPLSRVDSTSFMLGNTGTNYKRGKNAWKGSLLLMVSHGGWINTIHGNLEYLTDDDARWLARVQAMYEPLQISGVTRSFGGTPGDTLPYGFGSEGRTGALYAVVNPSQRVRTIQMPPVGESAATFRGRGRILFRDAGFTPILDGDTIQLGPGQLALVGYGRFNSAAYDLGIEADINIPHSIERLDVGFASINAPGEKAPSGTPRRALAIEGLVPAPEEGDLRIVLRRRDTQGAMNRRYSRNPMGQRLVIEAFQDGKPLPLEIRYDKVVWSGLSWAVAELRQDDMVPGRRVRIRLSTTERDPGFRLDGRVYRVEY